MRADYLKLLKSMPVALFAAVFLISAGMANAAVTLTARTATTTLPDGQTVPMWGLFCGAASAVAPNGGTCTAQNGAAQNGTTWQPPLIRVQSGARLDIVLANNLKVPTSLVIVGQLGGGLSNSPTRTPSPVHPPLNVTWPIAGDSTGPQFIPPSQKDRVSSFGTEVAAGGSATLSWVALKPGTYLIESGTHPSIQGPMGLYGVLVVTDTTVTPNLAYAGISYDADVPLLLSEIDPVQNAAVDAAVNYPPGLNGHTFSETLVWSGTPGACGDIAQPITAHWCYPPAVNYTPAYYLINGVSFDRTNPGASAQAVPATAASGKVLLRFVNAGLRMHVPSVVGLDMNLIAEDGNVQPDVALALAKKLTPRPKVQNEIFLAAGKTYDIAVTPPASGGAYAAGAFAVFDRELSLSTNNQRDGGMQAYVQVAGGALPASIAASALPDSYYLVTGNTLIVADPSRGVMANDIGVYGVKLLAAPTGGSVTLNPNGTFTYVPAGPATLSDSFTYCANGSVSGTTCSSGISTTVTLMQCTGNCLGGKPTANDDSFTSNIASRLNISPPGVLGNDNDPSGLTLTASLVGSPAGGTVALNPDGSFIATPAVPPTKGGSATVTFHYVAVNSQHTSSSTTSPATVTVTFKGGSGLAVTVKDAPTGLPIGDYRWIIEEDRTFYIDPATQINTGGTTVPSMGTNFHTSFMPVVATGCVGTVACEAGQTVFDPATASHLPAVCDQGNGVCRTNATQQDPVDPSQVALDPAKRYYLTILPGDAANGFIGGAGAPVTLTDGTTRPFSIAQDCGPYSPGASAWDPTQPTTATCGHGLGGAPIVAGQTAVNVLLQETPLPTAKITVSVFEDDAPLNGEYDIGGGANVLSPNEPGLGGFAITLFDQGGTLGDATGQITYDMFNMPVSNSLVGTIDPATGLNACPATSNPDGLVGVIVTCPNFESDGVTPSPLAGQAVIANLYPGLYEVVATPGADRIARGEEWLQTNTLDGTKPHEAFIKPGEPAYFQEFGPAGFHVSIGFANPKIINDRKAVICANQACNNSVTGQVTTTRLSRTPDQRMYSSGSYDANAFTQCYVSLGDPTTEDFSFTKCNADGTFSFSGIPDGNWRITVFDQWNDLLVDGLSTPVTLHGGQALNMGDIPMQHWRTNVYTRTYFDQNADGVSQDTEPGLALVSTNIRYRDGSVGFFNSTDLNGYAAFNEVFPLANWLVLEADTTRFKQTGVHVVYDAGGPADGTPGGGSSTIADHLANTLELPTGHLPSDLHFPGSVYCNDADCLDRSGSNPSTGRIDPPWVTTEAWQGLLGQAEFVEFGKAPYATGENGGIKGEVNYASTRPFDDPSLLLKLSWEPNVPHVTVNLYKEGLAPDGTMSLTMVDTTQSSSWDDWAQGFRSDGRPNMNCPGQDPTSPFYFTLKNSTQWLNPGITLPYNSQYKCYDGWAIMNQVQPAPYDGMYQFPSIVGRNPSTGAPAGTGTAVSAGGGSLPGTNCTICIKNPVDATPMLPPGKYVVEIIVPPGYELVKEEDKNILIGDNYIAPVSQQFAGLGNIFILPDQAMVNAAYNPNNAQNATTNLGSFTFPRNEGDTGSVEAFWPCVGAKRIVPDYLSLYPGAQEVAPFAGASRNLCDRKEVTLSDQSAALAKFYIFSSSPIAAHFTGVVNDDYASEFDPFSPQFGEKFAVPNLPISIKDWAGAEIARTYSDQWGVYNGLTSSSWEVNPPNRVWAGHDGDVHERSGSHP
jgi:FtsP/CotA-like multicopper oxidase with cupredoxin domain